MITYLLAIAIRSSILWQQLTFETVAWEGEVACWEEDERCFSEAVMCYSEGWSE